MSIIQPIKKLCFTVLLMVLTHAVMAQTVTGTVVYEDDGEPVIGATVKVKGQTATALTDVDGKFSIAAKTGEVLEFSFVGLKTTEQTVTASIINIRLASEQSLLDEVVVVGYGVQKKKLVTGANLNVGGDLIQKQNQVNPLQALQGQAAGVTILSTSGQPGASMKVNIRGLGTIGNSDPLYVIDGIPGGDISILNPADIQSIDVLKDAASAAIYGAQAANGVVLVTTRTGGKGKGQVSYDAYVGIQNPIRMANMLNAHEYKTIMNEQALNSGSAPIDFAGMQGLADTDWLSQMFVKDASTQSHSLNITGGSETSMYSLSLNKISQEGVVGGSNISNYERYGFRINTEHKLYKDILKVGQHLNFNYIKNNGISVGNQYNNTLRGAFITSPLSPVYSDNGKYGSPFNDTSDSPWYNGDSNPYGLMMTNSNNLSDNQRLLADVYAELQPIKNLRLKSVFGINYGAGEYRNFNPLYRFSVYSFNEKRTVVNQGMDKGHTMTWTNTAAYDFSLNNRHNFDVLVGMESQRYQGTFLSASNWNLLSQFDNFEHAFLDNTTGKAHLDEDGNIVETRFLNGGPNNLYRRVSYFGRVGYNFQEKYMFNATLRADGSSKFSRGNRWGYFPSFSAGWVISNEDFIANKNLKFLNFLKLRASWGQVGNQNISDFQFASPINTSTGVSGSNPAAFYVFGTSKVNVPGAYPLRLSNPGIRWETSEQTNIGFDAHFLKSKLEVYGDFYVKTTKDWLVQAPILATAGTGAPIINGGDVKNTGVELAVSWKDQIGELKYRIGANGAYNKNVVGNIPTEDGIIHGETGQLFDNSDEFYRAQNGMPIGYFWGYKTDGLFQNYAEIEAWKSAGKGILQPNVRPGDVRYVDVNGDGKIDASDKVNLGVGMPKFVFGFNVGLDYKNFDLSVVANGVAGNKIVQSYRNHTNKQANYTTAVLQRWTGEGTSDRMPRVTETNVNWQFSDLYIQNGDFLRISNVTLGYDFAKSIKWKALSQLRLYAQAQNLLTFTKYDGMDPEIGYGTAGWVSGIDLGYYPRPKIFLVGLNVKF
jgi:TonB-linked SusC/RagA family outer membrane protein